MNSTQQLFKATVFSGMLALLSACAPGANQSSSGVGASSVSHNVFLKSEVVGASSTLNVGAGPALGKLCAQRVRVKRWEAGEDRSASGTDDSSSLSSISDDSPGHHTGAEEDSIVIFSGELDVQAGETLFGSVKVPEGRYRRLEIDLAPGCSRGASIVINNLNGEFSTNETMRVRFSGDFTIASDGELHLDFEPLVRVLTSINQNTSIKSEIELIDSRLR